MKDVLLFKLTYCPHCRLALRFQEELLAEHPEWRDIPVRVIDEAEEAALAAQIAQIERENAQLQEDLDNADNPELIEEIARNELGMVMQDEKVFYTYGG